LAPQGSGNMLCKVYTHPHKLLSRGNAYHPKFSHIDQKILEAFFYLCQKAKKNYCWPSQMALLRILDTVHGIQISRRTLNYHLKSLESNGFIRRIRRIKRGKSGQIEFHSTLYQLLNKAKKVLKNLIRLVGRVRSHFKDLFRSVELEPKLSQFEKGSYGSPEEVTRAGIKLLKEVTSNV